MKLDEIEKLAKYTTDVDGFVPRINAATDLVTLARFVLAVLPLVRESLDLYERAGKCHDWPYMGCPIDHSDIESALYDGVEAFRKARR